MRLNTLQKFSRTAYEILNVLERKTNVGWQIIKRETNKNSDLVKASILR